MGELKLTQEELLLKLSKEECLLRMLVLPEDEQQEALELLAQIYADQGAEGEDVRLWAGTEHEIVVPRQFLMPLEEWQQGAEAQLADPALAPGEGMPGWEARVPAHVAESYKKVFGERMRQAQKTLAMFEDNEDSLKTF